MLYFSKSCFVKRGGIYDIITLKSFKVTGLILFLLTVYNQEVEISLKGIMHTYFTIFVISLAEQPSNFGTIESIYFEVNLVSTYSKFFVNNYLLDYLSGMPMQISLLNLLFAAKSNYFGKFVAPITKIYPPFGEFTPSSKTKNYVLSLLEASFQFYDLLVRIESIQSIKIIEGLSLRAAQNIFLIVFQVYPTSLFMTDDADRAKKVHPDQLANALQINVFPLPGGPYSKIPFGGALIPLYKSGLFLGLITAYYNVFFISAIPTISLNVVLE